jgi:hypothetical protein
MLTEVVLATGILVVHRRCLLAEVAVADDSTSAAEEAVVEAALPDYSDGFLVVEALVVEADISIEIVEVGQLD